MNRKQPGEGVSFVEFVILAFAHAVGNIPKNALEWKIKRIRKKDRR